MDSAWDLFKESYGALWQFYKGAMQVQCTASSIELGIESGIVTYLLTRIAFKRPQKAFKYGSTAMLLVPAIYWPLCRLQEKKQHFVDSGVTMVDTQREMETEKNQNSEDVIKIDSA